MLHWQYDREVNFTVTITKIDDSKGKKVRPVTVSRTFRQNFINTETTSGEKLNYI